MKPPSANQIHLWLIDAVMPNEQQAGCLSASEQARYVHIRAPRTKLQYWQTRWAIRHALSCYAPEVAPQDWQFSRNAYGRPALQAPSLAFPIDFNISHTRGALVMAFTARGAVGVDVEYTQRQCRALAVAQRYFSASEVADLRGLPAEQQRARFFDLWTLKEAYIKACGMGLAIPLGSFSFNFAAPEIAIAFDSRRDDSPARWRFWQLPLSPTHQLALALGSDGLPEGVSIEGIRLQADGKCIALALNELRGPKVG
jgi:4'-phosphopantetheinyl transferase